MFGGAAVLLAALAAIFQFAGFHQISPAGLAYTALACLALHITMHTWPAGFPWRHT